MREIAMSVLLLNILVWGSWALYHFTDTCFLAFDGCKQAEWAWPFFLGVQVPMTGAIGYFFVEGMTKVVYKH